MTMRGRMRLCATAAGVFLLAQPTLAVAQTAPAMTKQAASGATVPRDGQRDFDFMFGTWKATLKQLQKPLTGSTTWIEFSGTQHTQKVWGGLANMDEFVVDNPEKQIQIRGLTLRMYNPTSRQWSIYWGNAKQGTLSLPPVVGQFTNGRGEFYDQEEFGGRMILVRYAWSDITPTSAHFEQAFSADGGKTWEVNWISDITRTAP